MKKILNINIENFVQNVNIKRDYEDDDCEYEVTKKAMVLYLNYPCYRNWDIFLYGGTRNQYLKYGRLNKDGYRGDINYRGAYLLKNEKENKVLTADVLTSFKSIISKFFNVTMTKNRDGKIVPVTGEDVVEVIRHSRHSLGNKEKKLVLDKINANEKSNVIGVLVPYIFALSEVYYWCGNMMPMVCNFKSGAQGADNWVHKIDVLVEREKKEKKEVDKFINDNFLMDCYDGKSVKNNVTGYCIKSLKKENMEILCNNDYELAKELLLNHVKMIIQRSYRIYYQFSGAWNYPAENEHDENLQEIMKYVFEEAGFSEEEVKSETFLKPF